VSKVTSLILFNVFHVFLIYTTRDGCPVPRFFIEVFTLKNI